MLHKRLFAFIIVLTCISTATGSIAYAQPSYDSDTTPLLGAVQLSLLTPPHPAASDKFGWTVAISGDTAVVGAPNEDLAWGTGTLRDAGAVYVYARLGNEWNFQSKIVASGPQEEDYFGIAVGIDGNTIVVGAHGRDVEGSEDVGAAYVYTRQGYTWSLDKILTDSEPREDDNYGVAVAIDNGIIAIGAQGKDISRPVPFPPYLDAGKVFLYFQPEPGKWLLKKELQANDAKMGGSFGASVALEGDYLVVGATELNPYSLKDVDLGPGSAYIYDRNNNWNLDSKIDADADKRGDAFGYSVGVSGTTVVVGAPSADPKGDYGTITNGGKVYVFDRVRGSWDQSSEITLDDSSSFDHFGRAVDIYSNVVLVGAEGRSYFDEFRAGAAYIFTEVNRNEWVKQTAMVSDGPRQDEAFGQAVAIDGNNMLIGASGSTTGLGARTGKAFLFGLTPAILPNTGYPPNQLSFTEADLPNHSYQSVGGMTLTIPTLGIEMPIVSVPKEGGTWNVAWLWKQAGYLEGTAFPTWEGNTGIAGHVYLPNGGPGPFINLHTLKWGDVISITAWDETAEYEVRQVFQTEAEDLSVLSHEQRDWVTLVTCKEYNESTGLYGMRTVVRAVRVK